MARGLPPAGSPWGDDGVCHGIVVARDPDAPVVARCARAVVSGGWWCEVHREQTGRHAEWVAVLRSDWPRTLERLRRKP